MRSILGLEGSITMDVCFPNRVPSPEDPTKTLWVFDPTAIASSTGRALPECTYETATGHRLKLVRDLYQHAGISDQTSLPILFDKKTQLVVSNESSEIVAMLAAHAAALGATNPVDLYAAADRVEIDEMNEFTYVAINNGAYKAGFSSNQEVYDIWYDRYFSAFDELESRLAASGGPFLVGGKLSVADIRLFPTLFRHDPVYYTRMKLNQGMLRHDWPNLWRWLRCVYQYPGVAPSSNLLHCRQGYFGNSWNKVVPKGPPGYPGWYESPSEHS